MHNRGRLVVGSFLTKTLGIDWRRGAEVFFDLLVDGDVASNVGNWQWVAGSGPTSGRTGRSIPSPGEAVRSRRPSSPLRCGARRRRGHVYADLARAAPRDRVSRSIVDASTLGSRSHERRPRVRRELEGWRSAHRRGADGGVDSDECVRAAKPVVACSRDGALELGRRYWREVERSSGGVLRLAPWATGPCSVSWALDRRSCASGRRRWPSTMQVSAADTRSGAERWRVAQSARSRSRRAAPSRTSFARRSLGSVPDSGALSFLRPSSSAAYTSASADDTFTMLQEARR